MTTIENEVEQWLGEIYQPESNLPIYEWARQSGIKLDATSPIAGAYKISNSPWMCEQFDAFQSDGVRMVTSVGPNQGGRTKAMEIASLWCVKHRAGPMQWNTDHNNKAKDFAEERWWPTARSCPDVLAKMSSGGSGLGADRHKERICKIMFSDGMPFTMQGCSEQNLQQKSIMNQFNDEIFQWPMGRLEDAWIRCNVAYAWNYKVWNGSVAGVAGEDLEVIGYNAGTMEEWHWFCPHCKKKQIPKWGKPNKKGGIKFNSKLRFKDGSYNYEGIKKTVYYECEHCLSQFKDSSATRKMFNKTARYIAMNPRAPKWHRSFRFNILTVNWPALNWGTWVEEFLKATESYRRYHNAEPLKLFWTRRMAQFWEENKYLNANRRVVLSDYSLGTPNLYLTKQWEKETMRFMANDKQEDHYPSVIRAVAQSGESRLIYRGNLDSYAEIEAKSKEFGVASKRVLLDFGFEISECAAAVVKYGWTGMRGVDRAEPFKHLIEVPDGRGGTKVIKVDLPYSEAKWKDPMMGSSEQVLNKRMLITSRQRKLARYFDWINLYVKDMLAGFKSGNALYWGLPDDVGAEYLRQINSEVRHKIISAKGRVTNWWSNTNVRGTGLRRPNHYWDCECMIFCAMCMQGLIDLSGWQPSDCIASDTMDENELDKEAA